jgi:hypothetical protein
MWLVHHDQAGIWPALSDRLDNSFNLGWMMTIVIDQHEIPICQGKPAMNLKPSGYSFEIFKTRDNIWIRNTFIRRNGNSCQSIQYVVSAGHREPNFQIFSLPPTDRETRCQTFLALVKCQEIGIRIKPVSQDWSVYPWQDRFHNRVINTGNQQTVERQVVYEFNKCGYQILKTAVVVRKVILVYIR